jgi:hypothetical protein
MSLKELDPALEQRRVMPERPPAREVILIVPAKPVTQDIACKGSPCGEEQGRPERDGLQGDQRPKAKHNHDTRHQEPYDYQRFQEGDQKGKEVGKCANALDIL